MLKTFDCNMNYKFCYPSLIWVAQKDFYQRFKFPSTLHRVFTQDLAWGNLVFICILCSIHTFGCYFSNYIDSTILKRWAVLPIFLDFLKSATARYLVDVFICLFLDHTQGFLCGGFKMPHFLNFYFQVFVFTYYIIFFHLYAIICWHWHIN